MRRRRRRRRRMDEELKKKKMMWKEEEEFDEDESETDEVVRIEETGSKHLQRYEGGEYVSRRVCL